MWYVVDKYVWLLEWNNKELGLNMILKVDDNKKDIVIVKKNDVVVIFKGK